MSTFAKINDLTNSPLRKKHFDKSFIPETNVAVAMGRVSLKKNKDKGQSDVDQLEIINDYVRDQKMVLDKVWDVAETAAKHEKRKNFHEMLAYVKANPRVRHVIFSHQSRSNRNRLSAREIEAMILAGITVHFPRDNFKLNQQSGMEDWLRWDIFNNMNAKFIEDHKKNVAGGVVKRIEMGLYPGKPPFGYKNFRPSEDATSYFVFVPEARQYMESAFQLFSSGLYTWQALSKELAKQYPKLQKKPDWHDLARLLKNPFYYGDFNYDGCIYKGNPELHPPMISFSLWQRCQEVFKRPNRSKRKVSQREHPYLGLIRCDGHILDATGNETEKLCGWTITCEEKRKRSGKLYHYWRCSNRKHACSQRDKRFVEAAGRPRIYYSEAEIEALLGGIFEPLDFDEQTVKWMQKSLLDHHAVKKDEDHKERSGLQTRYEMLSRYSERAYEDKLKGQLDEETWRKRHAEWSTERDQIRAQLAAMDSDYTDYIETGVALIELMQRAGNVFENARPEVKRRLAEIVGSNFLLRDGRLEFNYNKPFDILAKTDKTENWWRWRESKMTG